MDNRRLVIAMLIAMIFIPAWLIGYPKLGTWLGYDMTPRPPATQPVEIFRRAARADPHAGFCRGSCFSPAAD